jgi:hypothetical protein
MSFAMAALRSSTRLSYGAGPALTGLMRTMVMAINRPAGPAASKS